MAWDDPALGEIAWPSGVMTVKSSYGSGLATRAGDPPGTVWAVGDRGPNLKATTAVKQYGATGLEPLRGLDGAKIMPRLDLGPEIAELRVSGDRVRLVRTIRLRGGSAPVPGVPIPGGDHSRCEPAFDKSGTQLSPDPSGVDSEGLAALDDGGFWVGDEYGPSLLKLDAAGQVLVRWVPQGCADQYRGADYPVAGVLPAIAAKRQLNRGFEALALSPDQRRLTLAFQSPLAHPDEAAHEGARHVRIWQLDACSGEMVAQFLYPLDRPDSFRRDVAKGGFGASDVKVGEIVAAGSETLLVLERGSETSKIYRVDLAGAEPLSPEHLDIASRPTIEELSAAGDLGLPVLAKQLLFSSDDARQVAPDLEGMALLSAQTVLLVSDNDFGVEGASTSFWRLDFEAPLHDD